MRKKIPKVQGFKMNRKTGHVSYAFWQKDKSVKSIGFTHDNRERYEKKILIPHGIDPKDKEQCYAKNKVENYKYNDYRDKPEYKRFRIHKDDEKIISFIIQGDKKKGR